MFTFVNMKGAKIDNSSLVRISNYHIRLAKKIKKRSGVPIGKTFEAAIEYYDYASKNQSNSVIVTDKN